MNTTYRKHRARAQAKAIAVRRDEAQAAALRLAGLTTLGLLLTIAISRLAGI